MRTRVLTLLVAAVSIQLVGCWRCCRCCRREDDRIPPAVDKLPPPASPSAANATAGNKPIGAYGGTGGGE